MGKVRTCSGCIWYHNIAPSSSCMIMRDAMYDPAKINDCENFYRVSKGVVTNPHGKWFEGCTVCMECRFKMARDSELCYNYACEIYYISGNRVGMKCAELNAEGKCEYFEKKVDKKKGWWR